MAKTKRDDLVEILEYRFRAPLPADLSAALAEQKDLNTLSRWFRLAYSVPSLDAFRAALQNGQEPPSAPSSEQGG
jgi:hypothetical protein